MKETHEHAVKRGSKSRKDGASFELRVRKDMTEKGWVVDKFGLNVEFDKNEATAYPKLSEFKGITTKVFEGKQWIKKITYGKLIQAKNKWAGPGRPMMMGAGFVDFICHKNFYDSRLFDVIGVECKCNGYLTKEEKEKCRWLLDNNVFSKILIAEKTKVKNRVVIVYNDFENKYVKKN